MEAPTEAPTCDACHYISFRSEKSRGRKRCSCTPKQCKDTRCSICESLRPLPVDECGCKKYECVYKECPPRNNQTSCHPCQRSPRYGEDICGCPYEFCGAMGCLELPPNSTVCEDVDECGCPTDDCVVCKECPTVRLECNHCQAPTYDRCGCPNGCMKYCQEVLQCDPGHEGEIIVNRFCNCEQRYWCWGRGGGG